MPYQLTACDRPARTTPARQRMKPLRPLRIPSNGTRPFACREEARLCSDGRTLLHYRYEDRGERRRRLFSRNPDHAFWRVACVKTQVRAPGLLRVRMWPATTRPRAAFLLDARASFVQTLQVRALRRKSAPHTVAISFITIPAGAHAQMAQKRSECSASDDEPVHCDDACCATRRRPWRVQPERDSRSGGDASSGAGPETGCGRATCRAGAATDSHPGTAAPCHARRAHGQPGPRVAGWPV
jgi:hypothetical protein